MRAEMPRVHQLTQRTDCQTRTCLTLLGASTDAVTGEVSTEATEIIEPSEPIPHAHVAALQREISARLSTRQVRMVVDCLGIVRVCLKLARPCTELRAQQQ